MNFNENDLWRDKTELLNLRLFKLPSVKDVLKPEFDTKDQVLLYLLYKELYDSDTRTQTKPQTKFIS